jgi:hypothetical protein
VVHGLLLLISPVRHSTGGGQRQQPVYTGIVVNNFNFNFNFSTEKTKILGGAMGTSDFARDVFETALSKYEAYGELRRGLAAHRHSHTALRIHQHYHSRFGHFARTVPRGLGRGEGYGDTVVTFLERTGNTTLDVAAEILSLPAGSLPRNTRSEMSLPTRFGGIGVGDLVALAHAAHLRAADLAVGSAIRYIQRKMLACAGIPTTRFRWCRPCMDG